MKPTITLRSLTLSMPDATTAARRSLPECSAGILPAVEAGCRLEACATWTRRVVALGLVGCALLSFAGRVAAAEPLMIDDRGGTPEWTVDPAFKDDVFTFARVRYTSGHRGWGGGYGRFFGRGWQRWAIDTPDADLNLTFRLQQMTSLKVNPMPMVVDLTPEDLAQYPFIYIVEGGELEFSDQEVVTLRNYLLNGGFLMFDDFWGVEEWENIHSEMQRVFPDREFVDLPVEHPIFHCVFDLKEKPQVPGIHEAIRHQFDGVTWERGPENRGAHYYGIFDDKQRMMVIICRNTDLGDGWEREGENQWYFRTYSEPKAYPMAINIIFYAMTH